jgi:hypothetical protein
MKKKSKTHTSFEDIELNKKDKKTSHMKKLNLPEYERSFSFFTIDYNLKSEHACDRN